MNVAVQPPVTAPKAALAWVSFYMVTGTMGTALISPLYTLYRDAWGLSTSDVSFLYVIYMMGALGGLLCFGRLADRLGYRVMLLTCLGLTALGTLASMLAPGLWSLALARFIVGVASSMATTAGSIALLALSAPEKRGGLALYNSLLIAGGFALGPLIGGVMGEFVTAPLLTAYLPTLFCAGVALLGFAYVLPRGLGGAPAGGPALSLADMAPKLTMPRPEDRLVFLLGGGLAFLAFGAFSLYASMAPLFIKDLLGLSGPLVSGLSVTIILGLSATTQTLVQNIPNRRRAIMALMCILLSCAALMINIVAGSAVLFALGIVLTAGAHALCILAGITVTTRVSEPHNRGSLLASFMVIGYVGAILPMMAMGWIADAFNFNASIAAFCLSWSAVALGLLAAILFVTRAARI